MGYWSQNGYKPKSKSSKQKDEYEYVDNDKPKSSYWNTNYFSKKKKISTPPASAFDKAESELAKKKAALKHYGIDDPTDPNRDDRNFVEKALNTPKNTGFLGDVFDVLSRGQYASANLAKNFARDIKENGASEILRRVNPFYSLKKTFGKEGREAIKEGVTGERKGSYDEALGEAGMKKGLGRSALGFVGDVGLDPTTYLSGGGTALSKVGGKVLSKVPGAVKAAKVIRESKPVEVLGKAFIPNFREAGTAEDVWNGYVDLKKGYQNSLQYTQNKTVEDAVKFGKGLSKKDRELVSHALQDPAKLANSPQHIKDAVAHAQNQFKQMWEAENKRGLIKEYKENYLPGIYPDKAKPFLQGIIKKDGLKATVGGHKKQKVFDTLQDAIDAGHKPETDIAKLLGHRGVTSSRAVQTQDFIDNVVNNYGKKINTKDIDKLDDALGVYLPKGSLRFMPQNTVSDDVLELLKNASDDELIDMSKFIKKGIGVTSKVPVVALPKQIASDLNNFKKGMLDEGTNTALKYLVDKPTNLWKGYATATNPGFHIRNAASNLFQTYLNNGTSLLNPKNHLRSLGVASSELPLVGDKISKKMINVAGQKMSIGEARELMKKNGVLNQGWFDKDIGKAIDDNLVDGLKNFSPKNLKNVPRQAKNTLQSLELKDLNLLNPLSTKNALMKTGRAIGSGVENQARAFNFLADLKRNGGNIEEAAKNTDKFLFDYGDLTDFEKNVMRRTVPFYTWLRKNIPLQAEQLIEQPGKYAAIPKAINAVESQSEKPDEKYLPDYMENWVRTPFKQSGNPVYLNPNMPYGDLDRLNPAEVGKTALSSLNPLLKIPLELTTNRETFFDSPIERFKGQTKKAPGYMGEDTPDFIKDLLGARMVKNNTTGKEELQVPAKNRYLMKQVPFVENISKSMDYEGDKKFNQLLTFLAGAKVAPYEIEKQKKNKVYDDRDKLRDFFDLLEAQGKLPDDWSKKIQKKKETKKGW